MEIKVEFLDKKWRFQTVCDVDNCRFGDLLKWFLNYSYAESTLKKRRKNKVETNAMQ